MKNLFVILSLLTIFAFFNPIACTTSGGLCSEQPYCLTVNLTTLLHVCRNFFRVPCPLSCGQCASEKFKIKFSNAIDPNNDGKIAVEEAQSFLKILNISLEDALVTEIKDLLLDTKAIVTDLYKFLDVDSSGIISINEYINGILNLFELVGVKLKPEFKESITHLAEIVKISNRAEILIPKVGDLIQIVSQQIGAYPHGLIGMTRLQNMTNGHFNLERVIITQQLGYSINTKLFISALWAKMDLDSDGSVSQSDFIYSLLGYIKNLNVSISPRVEEYLKSYFDIYYSSVQTLLSKYGLNDIGLLEGKVLPEYDNKEFINLAIPIKDSIQSAKKYSSVEIARYVRATLNGIPQRKLTLISVIESTFAVADRNKDGHIDIPEFVYFSVNNLPKEIGLHDMNEALKVMKLYDENNDDKLCSREFKELLKNDQHAQEIYLNTSMPMVQSGSSMPISLASLNLK